MTSQPPEEALPILADIRRLVPRPSTLPRPSMPAYGLCLRFDNATAERRYCPMGLLPHATVAAPAARNRLDNRFTASQVDAFLDWWDAQSDPQQATDAVWPPVHP